MGSLLDALAKNKPRESVGADTASRFDYQKNWALCEMLSRHKDDADYLVAFEFHDDVLFLTPEVNPNSAEFFQVKTSKNSTKRSIASLTQKGKSGSTIAKMMANTSLVDSSSSVRIVLVSNNQFEFSATSISASGLDDGYKKKFLARLKAEFPTTSEDVFSRLHFIVTDLPIDGIETFVKGRATELFEKRFGSNFAHNVLSWLRLIQGEIRRKNNYPSDKVTNVSQLIDCKCIGHTFIAKSLDDVETMHQNAPDMTYVSNTLQTQGWSPADIMKMNKASAKAVADYKDPSNQECKAVSDQIRQHYSKCNLQTEPLGTLLQGAFDSLNMKEVPGPYQEKAYITALSVLIYNEKL